MLFAAARDEGIMLSENVVSCTTLNCSVNHLLILARPEDYFSSGKVVSEG